MTVLVELLLPHTHAGQDYRPGHRIDLDDNQADWLIRMGVARPVPPDSEGSTDSSTSPVSETGPSTPTREKRR